MNENLKENIHTWGEKLTCNTMAVGIQIYHILPYQKVGIPLHVSYSPICGSYHNLTWWNVEEHLESRLRSFSFPSHFKGNTHVL